LNLELSVDCYSWFSFILCGFSPASKRPENSVAPAGFLTPFLYFSMREGLKTFQGAVRINHLARAEID